jgi:4'-phosphopantetheinyl transferase EntD
VIEALFPDGVVTVETTEAGSEDALYPEERAGLGHAVAKRRREFAAGRACARRALARLELADAVLPIRPDRLPAWPAGIVGSITHCAGYCGVAAARQGAILGLGLDAEVGGELEPALVPLVCRPAEIEALAALESLGGLTSGEGAKLVFSAKESAYKCFFPLVHRFLEFHDVEIELRLESPRAGSFTARILSGPTPVPRFHGRFLRDDARVYTGVTLLAGA